MRSLRRASDSKVVSTFESDALMGVSDPLASVKLDLLEALPDG
jgi:hypothetical protein